MCSNPECDKPTVFARGLCSACYTRSRRNGSVERKNMRNTGVCSEPDCGAPAFARGLCQRHYDSSRHPLISPWALFRSRNPGGYPPSWDRFDAFLADVTGALGERPSMKHQLRRLDPTKPYAVDNLQWLEPISTPDTYTPDQRAAYERAWRFKRKYGITVEDYDRMFAEQDGKCANCRQPPTQVHKRSGKLRDLAVDHDHETNTVRGLLCTDCNTAIGLLRDSPALLRAAAAYLDRHRRPQIIPIGTYTGEERAVADRGLAASFRPMTAESFEAVERRAREALGDAP